MVTIHFKDTDRLNETEAHYVSPKGDEQEL